MLFLGSLLDGTLIQPIERFSSSKFLYLEAKTVCCPNCAHKFVIGEIPPAPETIKKRKISKKNDEDTAEESVMRSIHHNCIHLGPL